MFSASHRSVSPASLRPTGAFFQRCSCSGKPGPSGECDDGHGKRLVCERIQSKLRVGTPDDRYEREADRLADAVVHTPAGAALLAAPARVQRVVAPRESGGAGLGMPASVDAALGREAASLEWGSTAGPASGTVIRRTAGPGPTTAVPFPNGDEKGCREVEGPLRRGTIIHSACADVHPSINELAPCQDLLVTTPEGPKKTVDALSVGNTLMEVKTETGKTAPPPYLRDLTVDKILMEAAVESASTLRCGYSFALASTTGDLYAAAAPELHTIRVSANHVPECLS